MRWVYDDGGREAAGFRGKASESLTKDRLFTDFRNRIIAAYRARAVVS